MQSFDALLKIGIEAGASDIHLSVGRPPSARVDGEICLLGDEPLTPADTERVIDQIIGEAHKQILLRDGEVDFAYAVPGTGRFRVNAFRQRGSYAIATRHSRSRCSHDGKAQWSCSCYRRDRQW